MMSIERLIQRLSDDYGSIVAEGGQHPIVGVATDLASKLATHQLPEKHESAWCYPLSDGGRLVACCIRNYRFLAFARQYGRNRVVALSTGVIKTVFELNAGLWTDPQFLHGVGKVDLKVNRRYWGLDLPRGLESVAASYAGQTINCLDHQPEWLSEGINALDSRRRRLLTASCRAAIEFLWRHELCHVLDGHLELPKGTGEHVQQFEEIGADDSDLDIDPRVLKGAEVTADRFAGKSMNVVDPLAGFVGTLVVFLAMCAVRQLRGRSLEGKTHPPVWYRTHAAMHRFGDVSEGSQLQRRAVADIESIHPMFGAVLNALTNRHYPINTAATSIEADALTAFAEASRDVERIRFAAPANSE